MSLHVEGEFRAINGTLLPSGQPFFADLAFDSDAGTISPYFSCSGCTAENFTSTAISPILSGQFVGAWDLAAGAGGVVTVTRDLTTATAFSFAHNAYGIEAHLVGADWRLDLNLFDPFAFDPALSHTRVTDTYSYGPLDRAEAPPGQGYYDGTYGATLQRITRVTLAPAPVPEPSTWALLIAGFGLVGVAVRRSTRFALAERRSAHMRARNR
ncbi:PEPxxWA-CTERM sorting domain-containing protein [uncultured Phenylobacterium sp.]|uniref:PEPxxWA-CTERM sorting domain-containing protein n=1 Tax=uncultured Phenylobacterium sp. TaxID=349273 RepID=UPI0025D12632|nr:PEPxxWA-CTERM sorting domain-containing protein [uncultured Phenylobacterium sp.]